MGRRFRLRKVTKWTGLVACALIIAAWGVSLVHSTFLPLVDSIVVQSCNGDIWITRWVIPSPYIGIPAMPGLFHIRSSFGFEWPVFDFRNSMMIVIVPYWLLLSISAIPTAILVYRDRRKIPPGHCRTCGYDLRSITSGRCPECGTSTGVTGET